MEFNFTTQILISFTIGLSTILLLRYVYEKYFYKKYKYPNEIDLSVQLTAKNGPKTLFDYFNENYEKCLIDWLVKYPNVCTLSLRPCGFNLFGTGEADNKILLLNSIEMIKQFSMNEAIANRPRTLIFDLYSHRYLGSFFRMFDEKLIEIRKTTLNGIQNLILANPNAEIIVCSEMDEFFTFLNESFFEHDKTTSVVITDMRTYMQQIAVNIVMLATFRNRYNYTLDTNAPVKQQVVNMTQLFDEFNILEGFKLAAMALTNPLENETSQLLEIKILTDSVYQFLIKTIGNYKTEKEDSDEIETLADLFISKQMDKLKNTLNLTANDAYSDDDITVQVFTVFMATCATTGFTLTWALYYLARNLDIQTKLNDEIKKVSSDSRFVGWKHRADMIYANAFTNELLRLASPKALIPRCTKNEINFNGKCIPANTPVLLNVFGIHNDPAYWKNPDEFQPERWLSDNKNENIKHFLAFGANPRICVGEKLARLILFSVIMNLVKNYELEFVPLADENIQNKGKMGIMRRPHEFNLKLKRRN